MERDDQLSNVHVLYVGDLWRGSTARHRMSALTELCASVDSVDSTQPPGANSIVRLMDRLSNRLRYPRDNAGINRTILSKVSSRAYNILWIDKGVIVKAETLASVRRTLPDIMIIGYSPDDVSTRHHQTVYFRESIREYDAFLTTKTFNVAELLNMGVRRAFFVPNAYAPEIHYPVNVPAHDRYRLGGPIGFIGAFEDDRAKRMLRLAEAGLKVRWWGSRASAQWTSAHPLLTIENNSVWEHEYSRAISSFDINLCFLRKINRDMQTTRSIEIPACRGFMLAERTPEHLDLFREAVEAEFFDSDDEMIEKTKYYLNRPDLRMKIAEAGWRRCIESGYSNRNRLKIALIAVICSRLKIS